MWIGNRFTPGGNMTPKRGQPPKPPEEKKTVQRNILMTEDQAAKVDAAKEQEAPEKRIGTYIRDVVVDHAEQVIKSTKKPS